MHHWIVMLIWLVEPLLWERLMHSAYTTRGTCHIFSSTYPAGEPSTSPRFLCRFIAEFQGIIPAEISSWFPCGNSWEIQGNFLCGYFRLLSLWNPWGNFHVEISLVLPSKISKCNLMTGRVTVMWKYPIDDLMALFGELMFWDVHFLLFLFLMH